MSHMIERLDAIEEKYNKLQEELTKPEVLNDFNKTKDISKKISDMEEVVSVYKKYKNLLGQIICKQGKICFKKQQK